MASANSIFFGAESNLYLCDKSNGNTHSSTNLGNNYYEGMAGEAYTFLTGNHHFKTV